MKIEEKNLYASINVLTFISKCRFYSINKVICFQEDAEETLTMENLLAIFSTSQILLDSSFYSKAREAIGKASSKAKSKSYENTKLIAHNEAKREHE